MGSCFSSDFAAYANLDFAITSGYCPRTVEHWLCRIKDINAVLPISKMTALELARRRRWSYVESLLLARGAGRAEEAESARGDGTTRERRNSNAEQTPSLISACERGYLDVARRAIEQGGDINVETQKGKTLVFIATKNSRMGPLRMLLESGANPNTRENNGSFALYEAVRQTNIEATRLLLTYGADYRMVGPGGFTILGVAINRKDLPMTKLLLDHGADTEQKCDVQWTPLMRACYRGFVEGMKVLIERGADINAHSQDGFTSLLLAAINRHSTVVSYLLSQDSCIVTDIAPNGYTTLHYVCLLKDSRIMQMAVNKGANVNAQTKDGETAAFIAVKNSCTRSLQVLLESGADPNSFTNDGRVALNEAVKQQNFEAAGMLLRRGAEITVREQDGRTVLGLAIERNDVPMIKLLLDHKADMEQTCVGHWTSLMTACSCGFLESVKILVERGANLSARMQDGSTSLLLATMNGHSSVVSYLLYQNSRVETDTVPYGYSALHYVSLLDHSHTAEMIVRKGADVNAQNQDGETPVFVATKNSRMNCLRVLLEAGADPDICTKDGEFPLHEAVNQDSTESVRMLLTHGADRTKTGRDGLTAIQRALTLTPSNSRIVNSLLNDNTVAWTGEEDPFVNTRKEEEELNKLVHEVEQCVHCPITFEVMRDPVVAADGHTYEREAIEQWLRQKQESPVTRQPLSSCTLTPNVSIRHLVNQYMPISEGQ